MSLVYINTLSSLVSLTKLRSHSKSINRIDNKLNFIQDDLSWIGSNDGGKLVKEITKLRSTYEEELAKIHTQIIGDQLFKQDISALVDQLQESHPEFFDFILKNELKLFDLVAMSSNNILELYQISEELALQIEEAVSSISMIALKYGMSIQDLSLKVDSNEKYILILSQKLMDVQASLTSKFYGIKQELDFIQEKVDRQLVDVGLASNNTTAVLLSDGSLHISDSLRRYSGNIFVGKAETNEVSGSSSSFTTLMSQSTYQNANRAALIFNTNLSGATSWKHSSSSYSNTVKLKNIVPIGDDKGILLDLSTTKDVIIQDINLTQPIFIVLKGGGLANIDIDNIVPMFRPAMISRASLSMTKWKPDSRSYEVQLQRSAFSIVETTVGAAGTFIIPVSNSTTNYPQFLRAMVQSKSDNLIIIRVDKLPGWTTILTSATEKGGYVNGKTLATLDAAGWKEYYEVGSASGFVFQTTSPASIVDKGDLIVRLPTSYLTFHGVEVLY